MVNLATDILNSERSNELIEVKQETTKKQHQSNNLVKGISEKICYINLWEGVIYLIGTEQNDPRQTYLHISAPSNFQKESL